MASATSWYPNPFADLIGRGWTDGDLARLGGSRRGPLEPASLNQSGTTDRPPV